MLILLNPSWLKAMLFHQFHSIPSTPNTMDFGMIISLFYLMQKSNLSGHLHTQFRHTNPLSNLCISNLQASHKGFDGPALGPKMATENKREFTDEQIRAGRDSHIGLQAGYNKGANQSGINMGNTRHIVD